ncbi:uncharacterized protein F5147DRAFT_439791 [Suillus discolor]|uniref:Uncharacterized protein n=1 Tax=Suillus discolor TaxID=1912936 RepID=A0A9P7EVI0_9AGAM|nr:uncharacterized protein F5147DRAFT_439791 [Suillus discolor]KAG2091514.1 hypothetical protein F5147DRAFT_439791 [Suillus discolor]
MPSLCVTSLILMSRSFMSRVFKADVVLDNQDNAQGDDVPEVFKSSGSRAESTYTTHILSTPMAAPWQNQRQLISGLNCATKCYRALCSE